MEIPSWAWWFTELCILALERPCWIQCSLVRGAGKHEGQGGGFARMIFNKQALWLAAAPVVQEPFLVKLI